MRLLRPLPDEKLVIVIQKHWVIFLASIALNVIVFIVPIPVLWFLKNYFPAFFTNALLFPLTILVASAYFLTAWLFFFVKFIDLYLDAWMVTNKRILSVEQRGMFSRIESEHRLDRIQDITTEVHGVGATFLNYGDLHVQTAGESQRFIFRHAPEPYVLKEMLMELVEQQKPQIQKYTGA